MSNTTQTTDELAQHNDATDAAPAEATGAPEHIDIPAYLPDILVTVDGGIVTSVRVLPGCKPQSCFVLDWDDVCELIEAAQTAWENLFGEAAPQVDPTAEVLPADALYMDVDAIRARLETLSEVYRWVY